ncbi:MAG TPA: metallophosphoesterase [Microbacteriaceae bacterium]|nr:metallophosphoesterase [Microbacteriaceae bacterium]
MTTTTSRAIGTAVGTIAAVGIAAFAWGSLIERNRFTVREEIVPVLAPGARPITVLHLSDLHMAPWQRQKQEWVARVAELVEPDLVVSTGDLLGHEAGLQGLRRALAPLAGRPGVFVHGSNDWHAPRPSNWLRYLVGPSSRVRPAERLDTAALVAFLSDELGWWDLNNRARAVELRGTRLELIGTDDPHVGLDRLDLVTALVDEMRAAAPERDDDPLVIGVTHAPYRRILDGLMTQGAELLFAGHTHGGQVCIPGVGALVTNCDLPTAQASGLSTWRHARREAFLEVSAGIGTSIYAPVRFACPPEAVVLTLVAR